MAEERERKCVWDERGLVCLVICKREANDDHEEARHNESFVPSGTGWRLGRSHDGHWERSEAHQKPSNFKLVFLKHRFRLMLDVVDIFSDERLSKWGLWIDRVPWRTVEHHWEFASSRFESQQCWSHLQPGVKRSKETGSPLTITGILTNHGRQ